jgi:hypothetical protein
MSALVRDQQTWLTSVEPADLFRLFNLLDHPRKARLWFVGCCRLVWDELSEDIRAVVDVTERFAEGQATVDEVAGALQVVGEELAAFGAELGPLDDELYERCVEVELGRQAATFTDGVRRQIAQTAQRCLATTRVGAATYPDLPRAVCCDLDRAETAHLLRCIFANPFRAVLFDPVWRTDTVLGFARVMCETHDFSAMPILADALQDAGCDSDDILHHCRGPGPHVRGCWVVDQILGKS